MLTNKIVEYTFSRVWHQDIIFTLTVELGNPNNTNSIWVFIKPEKPKLE